MITKPEQIIKRITKAVGKGQSVLILGDWQDELIKGIKENQNSIMQSLELRTQSLEDNSFTRIITNYNCHFCFKEARRLLLPTGFIIITAHLNLWFLEKLLNFITRKKINDLNANAIKLKQLQDLVHDNGFLIEAYNGYPTGHILMIAQIQNKEVSTLFSSEKQETL